MPLRSHVDPCLFVPFIHVHGMAVTDDLSATVSALTLRHGDPFAPVLRTLHSRTHQVVFHETYHYWQGLRLPFLFRYALLSYRLAMLAFGTLSKNDPDFLAWSCEMPQFLRLSIPSELGLSRNGMVVFGTNVKTASSRPECILQITPLNLIESAATLAEYQVTADGARFDPNTFKRWCKRNPGYTELYEASAFFFGDQRLALRCLLPLINACFHTSIPERAFAVLLARTWGTFAQGGTHASAFLAQAEPCRWTELYSAWLAELDFDPEPSVLEPLDKRLLQTRT